MTRTIYRLALAILLSLLLHASAFVGEFIHFPAAAPPAPPIRAEIKSPRPPPPPPLALDKPEPTPRATARKQILSTAGGNQTAIPNWQQEVRRQFRKQQESGLFYPPEAIAQGLEGEVLVLMILNDNGQVVAARVEQGSGQRLLDDAALKAVRALHALPTDAPREALLPVRFRLH